VRPGRQLPRRPAGRARGWARWAVLTGVLALGLWAAAARGQARVFYVTVDGSDTTGDGTFDRPWATLNHAMQTIPDEMSTVVVGPGTYADPVVANRPFTTQTTLRAETAYVARLEVRTAPAVLLSGASSLTVTGFEITRPAGDTSTTPLVLVTDRLGTPARKVSLRSNVIHDTAHGALVEVQSGTEDVVIESNVLYNPGQGTNHVLLDGVDGALVRENVFFNDYVGSGRTGDVSASYLAITNAGGNRGRDDQLLSRALTVDRNIFMAWQGLANRYFVQLGGSGADHLEVDGAHLDSNLFLGHSRLPMAAPLGVLGARAVSVRANTIAGNLPSTAFVAELDRRGASPPNESIEFYNNIFSDPTGTMSGLSDGDPTATVLAISLNNLYWNGGRPVPEGSGVLSVNADPAAYVDNPLLPGQADVVVPRWDADRGAFTGGFTTYPALFESLAGYARTVAGSPAINHGDGEHMPLIDLLGRPRGVPDIGALEYRPAPTATPLPPGNSRLSLPFLLRRRP
jgi:hypothetical protein